MGGKKNGEDTETTTPSTPEEVKIKLVQFCDSQGVNPVDRNAVFMKFGKATEKTETEWYELLKTKITLRKTDKKS